MTAKAYLRCFHCFIIAAIQIALAAGAAGQDAPAAASSGREYFVVWKHSLSGGRTTKLLMGARVSANGTVLPPGNVVITPNIVNDTRPGIASCGDGLLAAWADDRAGTNGYNGFLEPAALGAATACLPRIGTMNPGVAASRQSVAVWGVERWRHDGSS